MDNIKINASEIEFFLENGEGMENFFEGVLAKAVEQLKESEAPNFIINKIIIVNDLEKDDEEEDE